MAVRTRLAFVAMLLFIGWVFASPYRASFQDHASSDSSSNAPPTLQIQRLPSKSPAPPKAVTGTWPEDYDDRSKKDFSRFEPQLDFPAPVDDGSALPIEQSATEVAPVESRFAAVSGVPESSSLEDITRPFERRPLQPVRIQEADIGRPTATPKYQRGRSVPVQRPQSSLNRDAAFQHSDDSRFQPAYGSRFQQPARQSARPTLPPVHETHANVGDLGIRRPQQREQTRWHRIVNGDSLTTLAKKYYGDPRLALMIYDRNRSVLVSPEILPLGAELQIPPASPNRTGGLQPH